MTNHNLTSQIEKIDQLSMALLSLRDAHKLPDSVASVIQELNDQVDVLHIASKMP